MAGVAAKFIPRELLVHTPDGAIRPLLLDRDRYTPMSFAIPKMPDFPAST
jgi:hypothetical protein